MKNLTLTELREKLFNVDNAQPVTLTTKTIPNMRKTGNPFVGNCFKVARINGFLGADYERGVKRQGEREGNENAQEFKAQGLTYGQHISRCLIEHDGKSYVQFRPLNVLDVRFVDNQGNELDSDKVRAFIPDRAPSAKQSALGNEKEILCVNYKLESIKSIAMQGENFVVV